MRKIFVSILLTGLFFLFISLTPNTAEAYKGIGGYYKRNGTYVQPYYRTNPNSFKWDNWSSKGNINPFNGRKGYKSWWP